MTELKAQNHLSNSKNMKTLVIIGLFLLSIQFSTAQVGIGTTSPNASAQLDITSSNKGLLPPRVTLTGTGDATTIASPVAGLVVYNTATTSDVVPGFYYYNGSAWTQLVTGVKTAIEAGGVSLSASSSGNIYFSQNTGYPVIPENLPDGFNCEIVNYSDYPNDLTTLSTVNYYTKNTGWSDGFGATSLTIPSGGTIRLLVFTINGSKRYFVTGDIQ
jgi:hypothetical protein